MSFARSQYLKYRNTIFFDTQRIASWELSEAVLSASWNLDSQPDGWGDTIALANVYAKLLKFGYTEPTFANEL